MTLTVSRSELKKPARNKQRQTENGIEFEDDEDEELNNEEIKVDLIQLVHDDNKKGSRTIFSV